MLLSMDHFQSSKAQEDVSKFLVILNFSFMVLGLPMGLGSLLHCLPFSVPGYHTPSLLKLIFQSSLQVPMFPRCITYAIRDQLVPTGSTR